MPLLRLFRNRPFALLLLAAGIWFVLPVIVKRFARAAFYEFAAPADFAASYARDLQEYWALRTRSANELIETTRELARLNAQYAVAVQENASLHDELQRLEETLHLPSRSDYRTEIARVARRDFNTWWQRLIIRKGRNYGLTVGDPVIFTGGVVGRVVEVDLATAVVDLVSSPTFRVAASVDGDSRPFSYEGGPNPPFAPARGRVEFVPLDVYASAQTPKRIVTAGLGGVFPAGLVLGYARELALDTNGLFKSGELELDPRLNEVHEVAVLVPLNPEPPAAGTP